MTGNNRKYDVVVWGATGFTGSLVAEYLLSQYGVDGSLRWAIAGRSEGKLASLKESLGPQAASLPSIVADSFDESSLAAMAASTRVVISTVGPYAKYGSQLVAACATAGTHYCDLAGEPQWIRLMIDRHHDTAIASGAKIVHCCGFDSVPSDIGVWFLQQEALRRHGNYCKSVTMLLKAARGGPSGGTVASMTNLIREARADRSVARVLADPYGLNPDGERHGPDDRDQRRAEFDELANVWTAPFVMAAVNTRVVRRSHALLDYPYGRDFRYREAVMTGKGATGWAKAGATSVGIGGFVAAAAFDFSRGLLERFVLPEPGEGPNREQRESGFFDFRMFGEFADGDSIKAKVTGDRDPGYGSTSKMLSECAVCLAGNDLPGAGGVLTPASAMGDALLQRLRANAGLTFELLDP
ncbi:MAG: saccharopine dehydrogenase NADP-binding domain-containing protein [Gammaproteobacteria bacterium]|nr:saccharopine dehydrogenase NADP-binding domain-containing protein [Gammaproteobacteria bacterium]